MVLATRGYPDCREAEETVCMKQSREEGIQAQIITSKLTSLSLAEPPLYV